MTDWVRLWHDMPTDPKWRVIARKSGQPLPCVIALFTLMMTTASAADDRGSIANLTNEDAAAALDLDEEDVAAMREAMQGRVLDGDRLSGWERRQPKRERENDDSSQRVAKHRAKLREGSQDGVTPCNATERHETPREDTETEKDTEKKDYKGPFAFAGTVIRLRRDDFDRWAKSYDALDLSALLQARDDWLKDQPEPERKRWFNSTSNFLAKKQQEARTMARKAAEPAFSSPC